MKPETALTLAAVGVGALALLYIARKGVAGAAGAVVKGAGDAATGTVTGIGSLFGVPETDTSLCAKARLAGNIWDTSLYCPAGTAITSAPAVVVTGIGSLLGVPTTDDSACQRALAEGRYWDASKACPASKFIGGVFSDLTSSKPTAAPVGAGGVPTAPALFDYSTTNRSQNIDGLTFGWPGF